MSTNRTKIVVPAVLVAAALTLAGCDDSNDSPLSGTTTTGSPSMSASMQHGSATPSGSPPAQPADFNDADVTFLKGMYPHHAQAIEMAKLVATRSQNEEVLGLAASIEAAQGPEMEEITALLKQFGKPEPSTTMEHEGMQGMASTAQLADLAAMSGPEFDKMFLTLMIAHHQGAIEMSTIESASGKNPQTKTLADAIATAQTTEIENMKALLTQI